MTTKQAKEILQNYRNQIDGMCERYKCPKGTARMIQYARTIAESAEFKQAYIIINKENT